MNIQQIQVRYQPAADRVLWELRTRDGEVVAVWLTRRMLKGLWPPLSNLVTQTGVAKMAPNATVLPEAREMMAQAARTRPLANGDFGAPFDSQGAAQPLGAEPMLPHAIDLGMAAGQQGVVMAVREPSRQQINLQLSSDLATAFMRLLEHAIAEADWGLGPAPAAAPAQPGGPATPSPPAPPTLLN